MPGTGAAAYPRNIGDEVIGYKHISPTLRKYILERFDVPVAGFTAGANATAFASGTTGATNILVSGPYAHEYFVLGAGQTVTTPVLDVTSGRGLNIAQDLTATEGSSWLFGGYTDGVASATAPLTRSKGSFVVGYDKGFFLRVKFLAVDASGLNPLAFGFRKAQAHQTALGSFTDYACVKAVVNATVADLSVETRLNSGTVATVATGQSVADNVANEVLVAVGIDGVARFFVNGVLQTTRFTMDTGDVVRPFGYLIHGAASPGATFIQEIEFGYSKERGV
jgi:hypothetical protein